MAPDDIAYAILATLHHHHHQPRRMRTANRTVWSLPENNG